jgi:hypothetical protein
MLENKIHSHVVLAGKHETCVVLGVGSNPTVRS